MTEREGRSLQPLHLQRQRGGLDEMSLPLGQDPHDFELGFKASVAQSPVDYSLMPSYF